MEAGENVAAGAVTDAVVIDRIRTDPAFARAASQWLVELAKQASASLQGPVPSEPGSATGVVIPENAKTPVVKQPEANASTVVSAAAPSQISPCSSSSASQSRTVGNAALNPGAAAFSSDRVLAQSDLTVRNLPKFLAQDQLAFWTLPLHSSVQSLAFWVPATFGTAALIGSDTAIEAKLPTSPTTVSRAADASTAGMLALARRRRWAVPDGTGPTR